MIVTKRIYNKELIKSIIQMGEIWDCVAEDGQNKEDFDPDVENECWLLMNNEDAIVALYNLHGINGVTVQIHAHVVPEYRKEYSKQTGKAALDYIIENTGYYKIIAVVPTLYNNVKKFCESFGFKEEGINRLSYQKNGGIVDQWLLGLTRCEYLNE